VKGKYRKYNNGGPTEPKKRRKKVYTDKNLYNKALKSYQDSISLNNYYNLQQEVEPQEPQQNKAAFDAMQEIINSGRRDTSRVNELRTLGDRIINESDGSIQWAGGSRKKGSYSPDLQYYTVQDDPDKGMLSKAFDKFTTNSLSPMINKASKYWLGNAYNAVWEEPNVTPVYMREDGVQVMPTKNLRLKTNNPIKPRKMYNGEPVDPIFKEYGMEEAKEFAKDMNEKVDSLYNTPGALLQYQSRFMDKMEREAVPADSTYYDPNLGATVNAGIYDPSDPKSNGDYSYFRLAVNHDKPGVSSTSKKPIRPKEPMVELPPKLPFGNMDMSKPPALRRVLPEIYGVKLNQQTGEFIYRTSEGEVRKKQGPDNAQFVNQNRAALERMRKNR
jgi:hypothetical protein